MPFNIEKATVAVKKEMRGAVNEGSDGGQNSGDTGGSHPASQLSARREAPIHRGRKERLQY